MATNHMETLGFQAEITQLLDLMIHSLYSNKEIFLRELISNASDAIDRLRFAALSDDQLYEGATDFNIRVSYDKVARTITIADDGIGMTRDEVIEHIGTIAKSGTREFLKSLTGDQQRDAHLIGQFGVGFYSSFVVADRVTLLTRHAGLQPDEAVLWESDGRGEYTITMTEKHARGTTVTLHLREGEDDLLDGYRLRSIIRKYSDHIVVPILMPVEGDASEGEADESTASEEQVNSASAIWTRPRTEITQAEYTEFYRHVAHEYGEPLVTIHSKLEGAQEYTLLLFVPSEAPFDLWQRDQRHGVKLYVKRIFIMDDAEQLMPSYLRFVRGIVDSSDLPLNVSRELLQQNRLVEQMRATATKRVLTALADLAQQQSTAQAQTAPTAASAEDATGAEPSGGTGPSGDDDSAHSSPAATDNADAPSTGTPSHAGEKYAIFWREFGRVLKEGLGEDRANREQLLELVRFASTFTTDARQEVSLAHYVARMKPGQKKIYFLTAETHQAASQSPLLEVFRQKGIEVLLLSDPVDFLLEAQLQDYQGHSFQSVARGALDLDGIEADTPAAESATPAPDANATAALTQRLRAALGRLVKEVRLSTRLTTSPACLVNDTNDLDPNLIRLLKSAGQEVPQSTPILEINARHALIQKLAGEEREDRFAQWAQLLYEQSVLSRGDQLEDPVGFVQRMNLLLVD